MQKYILMVAVLLITSLSSGCSNLRFPGVYKLTIEQGNIITQEMIDQLKPGMSREQVEYILGSALIKDTFNSDRWDYVYNIQKGSEPREQHRLSIFFKAGNLSYFSGDFVPSSVTEVDTSSDSSPEANTSPDADSNEAADAPSSDQAEG